MSPKRMIIPTAGALCAAVALTAAGTAATPAGSDPLPRGSETVVLDPADFTTRIDNRYWPMRPHSRWV